MGIKDQRRKRLIYELGMQIAVEILSREIPKGLASQFYNNRLLELQTKTISNLGINHTNLSKLKAERILTQKKWGIYQYDWFTGLYSCIQKLDARIKSNNSDQLSSLDIKRKEYFKRYIEIACISPDICYKMILVLVEAKGYKDLITLLLIIISKSKYEPLVTNAISFMRLLNSIIPIPSGYELIIQERAKTIQHKNSPLIPETVKKITALLQDEITQIENIHVDIVKKKIKPIIYTTSLYANLLVDKGIVITIPLKDEELKSLRRIIENKYKDVKLLEIGAKDKRLVLQYQPSFEYFNADKIEEIAQEAKANKEFQVCRDAYSLLAQHCFSIQDATQIAQLYANLGATNWYLGEGRRAMAYYTIAQHLAPQGENHYIPVISYLQDAHAISFEETPLLYLDEITDRHFFESTAFLQIVQTVLEFVKNGSDLMEACNKAGLDKDHKHLVMLKVAEELYQTGYQNIADQLLAAMENPSGYIEIVRDRIKKDRELYTLYKKSPTLNIEKPSKLAIFKL